LKIERQKGTRKFVFGIREPNFYKGVKVNGVLMTEKQFQELQETSENTQFFIFEILENKPSCSKHQKESSSSDL
jgi:hypothetical protein